MIYEVETLIEDERAMRSLPMPSMDSTVDPYFIWFGILQPNRILFGYPDHEIGTFLQTEGNSFCFPDPSSKGDHPFIFGLTWSDHHYYGIVYPRASHVYIFITAYPWFDRYLAVLETMSSPPDIDQLQRLYQTPVPPISEEQHRDTILEWGLPRMLSKLSITGSVFKHFLTAVILERPIVLISTDRDRLSATILCLPRLIYPFTYQCHVMPIVPLALLDLLALPTPFIAGVTRYPDNYSEISPSILMVNLDQSTILSRVPPLSLPGFDQLIVGSRSYPPSVMMSLFEDYYSDLFNIETVRKYRICRRNGDEKISVFLVDCFLESLPMQHRPFYLAFMETQIWTQAINCMLQEIDS